MRRLAMLPPSRRQLAQRRGDAPRTPIMGDKHNGGRGALFFLLARLVGLVEAGHGFAPGVNVKFLVNAAD